MSLVTSSLPRLAENEVSDSLLRKGKILEGGSRKGAIYLLEIPIALPAFYLGLFYTERYAKIRGFSTPMGLR